MRSGLRQSIILAVLLIAGCNTKTNHAPILVNPGSQTSPVGDTVNLAVSASDLDGDTLQYALSGQPDGLSINATKGTITGSPTKADVFNAKVTVTDGKGGSDSKAFSWTVQAGSNPPPPPPPPPQVPPPPPPLLQE